MTGSLRCQCSVLGHKLPQLCAVPRKRNSRIKRVVVNKTFSFCNRFSFRLISFHFSFCFDSFRLVSSQFISSRFISIHFVSSRLSNSRLASIHLVSFRFTSSIIRSFNSCSICIRFNTQFNSLSYIQSNPTSFVDYCIPSVLSFLDLLCACRTISYYFEY